MIYCLLREVFIVLTLLMDTRLFNLFFQHFQLIEMQAATPAESARTEDPGLSIAREAAEVLPAESVRRNGNQHFSPK